MKKDKRSKKFNRNKRKRSEVTQIEIERNFDSFDAKWDDSTKKGRKYTVSVAFPFSIVDNIQTKELQTYLISSIARSLAIFQVFFLTFLQLFAIDID